MSSCDHDEVHCASINNNDGTDATCSTAATQMKSFANDAAAEWKGKYE